MSTPVPAATTAEPDGSWRDATVPAEAYERDLVPLLFEPTARVLLDLVDPRAGERVLDLACGTGIVARLAAVRVGPAQVTGVDVNAGMLAVARREGPQILWRQADVVDTGLPAAAFDVALCQQGVQFFSDRNAAMREVHRVVRPGGRVAVSAWCREDNPAYLAVAGALDRQLPDAPEAAGFVRSVFSSSDPTSLRDLLTAEGFQDVRLHTLTCAVRLPSATAWARAFLGAAPVVALRSLDDDRYEEIVSEAAAALAPLVSADGFRFEVEANLALGRRIT